MQVKPVKGLSWGPAAIGNATWSGARLYDVLKAAGIEDDHPGVEHIQVACSLLHVPVCGCVPKICRLNVFCLNLLSINVHHVMKYKDVLHVYGNM